MTSPRFNLDVMELGPDPQLRGVDAMFLSDDQREILQRLRNQILGHSTRNQVKQNYYEAKQVIEHLDIAVPRTLTDIGTAVGWAGTTVDAIDERIDFLGWATDDGNVNGLDVVYDDNSLGVESNYAHIDSLTTGVSFVSVGNDDEYADRQIVFIESSSTASVTWDYRKRRSIAGLSQTTNDDGNIIMETLYLEDATILFERENGSAVMQIARIDQHNLGRCFMTRLPNRARPFQLDGRSEITRAVRYYTDAAVRTMLGMEVNREFYTAPQRFVLNAKPEDFGVKPGMSKEEKFRIGLSVAMGMINVIPPREDNTEGDPPSVIEMKPAPPTPYIEQVKAYSIQMSAETGLPATLFGFVTDNPTSADAIVKSEFRLTRKAARRIGSFGLGWKEVGLLSLLARDGSVDRDFIRRLRCKFANPMIPTPAATADELMKMIAAEVLTADSSVTYELYGRLDDRQIGQLEKDKAKARAEAERKAAQEAQQQADLARAGNPGLGGGPVGRNASQANPPADSASA